MEWTRRDHQARASPEKQEEEEENDQNKQQDDGTEAMSATRNRRMYDCSFCKRGFTNAQALGGHMNIHRKERAKYKRTFYSCSSSSNPNPNFNSPPPAFQQPTFLPASQPLFFPALDSQTSQGQYHGGDANVNLPLDQELLGVDLSLRLWSIHGDDNNRRPTAEKGGGDAEDDLDLELRLGHDP